MLLTFDISLVATGWTFGGKDGPEISGTFDCTAGSDVSKEPGPRYCRFQDFLADRITLLQPRAIFLEAPLPAQAMKGMDQARQILGLVAITEATAYRRDIAIVCEAHSSTVRAFFCGRGNANKDDVIAECFQRGWRPANHNVADAMAVHAYGVASPSTARLWKPA